MHQPKPTLLNLFTYKTTTLNHQNPIIQNLLNIYTHIHTWLTQQQSTKNSANLLPTGTTLAFQSLMPSFTNNGSCLPGHKYLTSSAIICFSILCFTFSFTDSFIGRNGKLYYGFATFKGLYIFNKDDYHDEGQLSNTHDEEMGQQRLTNDCNDEEIKRILAKYRIRVVDFVHAVGSCLVFVVYAMCSFNVQKCLFVNVSENGKALVVNLPLAVGAAVSFLFMLFPTRRRGIGYADAGKYNE